MQVVVDESIKKLDQVCTRFTYGHAQIEEEDIKKFNKWVLDNVTKDRLRFNLKSKLHFTSLSTTQKHTLVEQISKLPVNFRAYVFYVNSQSEEYSEKKQALLIKSLKHHRGNQPSANFIIEDASEYKNIHRKLPEVKVHTESAKGNTSFLLPDVLSGVFCGFLDIRDRSRSTDELLWYKLIYNQIRLQVIEFDNISPNYLVRANKLK